MRSLTSRGALPPRCSSLAAAAAQAERVKDLASVQGVRGNQLVGYGLVVGLDGTGDQTSQAPFTIQSIKNMLIRSASRFRRTPIRSSRTSPRSPCTPTCRRSPSPARPSTSPCPPSATRSSLRGGSLIMTPLRGVDGEVYAIAQGSLVVSGFGVSGKDGSRIAVNVPSAGRVPNGATVEREVPNGFTTEPYVMLNLHTPDFTTSARLTEGINKLLGEGTAQAVDGVSVHVAAPADPSQRIAYLSTLEADRNRAGRRAGARHRQFAHRHRGHRLARARDAGGGRARLAVGDHHRARLGEPAMNSAAAKRWWCRRARYRSTSPRRACSCSTPASISTRSCAR